MSAALKAFVVFLVSTVCYGGQDYSDRFDELAQLDAAPLPDPKAMREVYDRLFGNVASDDMESLSDTEVRAAFDAANLVSFYTNDPKYVETLEQLHSQLERRGHSVPIDDEAVYGALISVRKLESAEKFRVRTGLPTAETLPAILDRSTSRESTALYLTSDEMVLERQSVVFPAGSGVVVIAHPNCHFSKNAAVAIQQDELLSIEMKKAIWLIPPERRLGLKTIRDWNATFVGFPLRLVNLETDWPDISMTSTPTFYFFKNGKISEVIKGWPDAGHISKLRVAIRKIGAVDKVGGALPYE